MKGITLFLVILALFAVCFSKQLERCRKDRFWSEWSKCTSANKCKQQEGLKRKSYPVKYHADEFDVGRMRMNELMALKAQQWAQIERCRADGSCPELALKQSEGFAECINGDAGGQPCNNVDQMSFLDFQDLSGGASNMANDIWGWTDPETDDEYAIVCLNCGTSFVRMTDAENPVVVAYLPTRTSCTSWRDVKTVNDHAYIVSEAQNHGLQVVDLTRLRDLDSYTVIDADVEDTKFGNAHNIVSNEDTDYIYVVGATQRTDYTCNGGLLIYDVSSSLSPEYVGCYGDDGYVHDAQCLTYTGPDKNYNGNEICLCFNEDTFTIVDVTDKESMFEIAREGYDGARYTHQGWVTDDHTVVLMDDEADEGGSDKNTKTYIWDISDMENPVLMNTYVSDITVIDHNQYIVEQYAFQSNYQGGLRILEIDQNNYDLTEVGYFDVFPSSDNALFSGSWSNYPYFLSGIIPVTSMDYGLYIVRPDYDALAQAAQAARTGTQTRDCGLVTEKRECEINIC